MTVRRAARAEARVVPGPPHRAEEKRIKARLKTARAKAPVIDDEIVALRRLESVLRAGHWTAGPIRRALDALDALRNGPPVSPPIDPPSDPP